MKGALRRSRATALSSIARPPSAVMHPNETTRMSRRLSADLFDAVSIDACLSLVALFAAIAAKCETALQSPRIMSCKKIPNRLWLSLRRRLARLAAAFTALQWRVQAGGAPSLRRSLVWRRVKLRRRFLLAARLSGATPVAASDSAMGSDMAARALDTQLMMEGGELPLL
jgi:hypothetical protein